MRARNVKPALFKNEILGTIDLIYTVLFEGLWCLADREGRLEDRPMRIKAEIFPYRELTDINGYLTELERLGFICRYSVNGHAYIQVLNFKKHQNPHKTERASIIPEYIKESDGCSLTVKALLDNGEITDVARLIPDSLIPDSLIKKPPFNSPHGGTSCADAHPTQPDSQSQPKRTLNGDARFEEWWNATPKVMRINKKRCREIWRRKHLDGDADELIADVKERMEKDQKWIDGFCPRGPAYLNGERWEDAYQARERK